MSKTPHAQKEKSPAHSHIPFKVLLPPSIIRSGPTTLRASPKTNHRQRWRINVNIEFPSIDELHHRKKSRCTPTSALAVNLSPGLRLHPDTRQNNKSRKDGSPVSKLSPLRFFFPPGRILLSSRARYPPPRCTRTTSKKFAIRLVPLSFGCNTLLHWLPSSCRRYLVVYQLFLALFSRVLF